MSATTIAAGLAGSPGLGDELAGLADRLRRFTVRVHDGGARGGSGVVWRPDGVIVSNSHVVSGDRAVVELADGRRFAARLRARDAARDLAVLAIDADGLDAATPGDARGVRVGELVAAMGNPLGATGALTLGIVHAVERPRRGGAPRWIRADVRLAPGNSGGPLVDPHGRVLGINTLVYQGLGVAVPSTAVTRLLLPREAQPMLGIVIRPAGVRQGAGIRPGWLVLEVTREGAAHRAGVQPGDLLVGTAGESFDTHVDLSSSLEGLNPGGTLQLDLLRGGRTLSVPVRFPPGAEQPRAA